MIFVSSSSIFLGGENSAKNEVSPPRHENQAIVFARPDDPTKKHDPLKGEKVSCMCMSIKNDEV